jgi:hypothetical protein
MLLGAATTAQAQTPPPGGDERPTLTLFGLEMRPRLLFNNIGVDNNVKNEAVNPKKDFTFGAQPDLEITARPGPFKVVFLSSSEFLWYQKYKEERMLNRSSTVTVELNTPILRPFFSFGTQNTKARPSPEIDVRAQRHPRTMSAGAYLKLATRTNLMFKWVEARERFDEDQFFRGQDLAETLNSTSTTYEGSIGIDVTPLTQFSLVGGRDELRFDRAPLRDANVVRVMPTLSFNPQGPINGSLAVGYKVFEGLDPSLPAYKGVAMNGTISVLLGVRYRLETRLTRDVQYSYEETLPYYVLTGGRATLATQLNEFLDVRLTGGQDNMRYSAFDGGDSPGTDRLKVYGGGIGFRIGDRKRFVIQAEFTERDSDRDALRGYKNHRVFGTLTWGA